MVSWVSKRSPEIPNFILLRFVFLFPHSFVLFDVGIWFVVPKSNRKETYGWPSVQALWKSISVFGNYQKLGCFYNIIFSSMEHLPLQLSISNVILPKVYASPLLIPSNSRLYRCFLKASPFAKLDETMISFFWILFFYLRPVTLTVKRIPHILITCHRQMQVLKHERELSINGKLLLYKDHHRRLFHVIISSVSLCKTLH